MVEVDVDEWCRWCIDVDDAYNWNWCRWCMWCRWSWCRWCGWCKESRRCFLDGVNSWIVSSSWEKPFAGAFWRNTLNYLIVSYAPNYCSNIGGWPRNSFAPSAINTLAKHVFSVQSEIQRISTNNTHGFVFHPDAIDFLRKNSGECIDARSHFQKSSVL